MISCNYNLILNLVKNTQKLHHLALDQFDAMQTSLETYVKTGKTTTPNKGRGHRIHVKNTRYDVDNEDSEAETSEIKKVCY